MGDVKGRILRFTNYETRETVVIDNRNVRAVVHVHSELSDHVYQIRLAGGVNVTVENEGVPDIIWPELEQTEEQWRQEFATKTKAEIEKTIPVTIGPFVSKMSGPGGDEYLHVAVWVEIKPAVIPTGRIFSTPNEDSINIHLRYTDREEMLEIGPSLIANEVSRLFTTTFDISQYDTPPHQGGR